MVRIVLTISTGMKFRWKIFSSIFATTVVIVAILTVSIVLSIQNRMREEFVGRYRSMAEVVGNNLHETESSVERLSQVAAEYLRLTVSTSGLPSPGALKSMAKMLGVSQLAITDAKGRFIRDTITPIDQQTKVLFDFCDGYKKLVTGDVAFEATPILPSFPYKGPFKFMMIPSHDRKNILEVGMRITEIATILSKAIRTDPNIRSIGVLSPTGFNFGTINADGTFVDGEEKTVRNLSEEPAVFTGDKLIVTNRVVTSSLQCCECQTKKVSASGEYYYLLRTEVSTAPLAASVADIQKTAILLFGVLTLLSAVFARLLSERLVSRLSVIETAVRRVNESGDLAVEVPVTGRDEFASLGRHFNQMAKSLSASRDKMVELEKTRALNQLASQVAHDIRSPLTALEMVVGHSQSMTDEQRALTRSAISRIQHIASTLLQKRRESRPLDETPQKNEEPVALASLLKQVVSEKRAELLTKCPSKKVQLEIRIEDSGADAFARMEPGELARVISNLMNNSVEAIADAGLVRLTLSSNSAAIEILVEDDGQGIAPEIQARLFKDGASFGKANGNGLGLSHAKEILCAAGGGIEIDSDPGQGTRVKIDLPKAPVPRWYAAGAEIPEGTAIVICDDDESVLQLWKTKLTGTPFAARAHYFSHPRSFETFMEARAGQEVMAFVDYEFRGFKKTGLDLIKGAGLKNRAVLITSKFGEAQLFHEAESFGFKLRPKNTLDSLPVKPLAK